MTAIDESPPGMTLRARCSLERSGINSGAEGHWVGACLEADASGDARWGVTWPSVVDPIIARLEYRRRQIRVWNAGQRGVDVPIPQLPAHLYGAACTESHSPVTLPVTVLHT